MMKYVLLQFAQAIDTSPLPQVKANDNSVQNILNIVFGIVGVVTFLMIVIGGFRYVLAGGDPAKMAQAKKTILYALIGLVVVLSAYSIVTFVIKGVA